MIFKPYDYTLRYEGRDYACRCVDISSNIRITKFVGGVEPEVREANEGIRIHSFGVGLSLFDAREAKEIGLDLVAVAVPVAVRLDRNPMAEEVEL